MPVPAQRGERTSVPVSLSCQDQKMGGGAPDSGWVTLRREDCQRIDAFVGARHGAKNAAMQVEHSRVQAHLEG